jgi:hypothetical protein
VPRAGTAALPTPEEFGADLDDGQHTATELFAGEPPYPDIAQTVERHEAARGGSGRK